MSRQSIGKLGEDAVAAHYLENGFVLLARNWRTRLGELDIIAARQRLLVICEVKCRTGSGYGTPAEAVTKTKQDRIRRLAQVWLAGNPGTWREIRFDVAEVLIACGRKTSIDVIEAAF